jgi:hypothetical protein
LFKQRENLKVHKRTDTCNLSHEWLVTNVELMGLYTLVHPESEFIISTLQFVVIYYYCCYYYYCPVSCLDVRTCLCYALLVLCWRCFSLAFSVLSSAPAMTASKNICLLWTKAFYGKSKLFGAMGLGPPAFTWVVSSLVGLNMPTILILGPPLNKRFACVKSCDPEGMTTRRRIPVPRWHRVFPRKSFHLRGH